MGAIPEERRPVYSMEYFLGLRVSIVAPYLASPGENITVTVRVEVSGNTQVEFIYINIYGLENQTEEISLANISMLAPVAPGEKDYIVTISNDTSPGLIYGKIEWKWTHEGATITPPPAGFVVTYVRNVELEELQAAYDELNATYYELNATYNSLLANHTKLKNYESELGATRNLMYIFVATTVVSAVTAMVLLIRGPKRPWT